MQVAVCKVGETVVHLNCVLDEGLITIVKNSREKFCGCQ